MIVFLSRGRFRNFRMELCRVLERNEGSRFRSRRIALDGRRGSARKNEQVGAGESFCRESGFGTSERPTFAHRIFLRCVRSGSSYFRYEIVPLPLVVNYEQVCENRGDRRLESALTRIETLRTNIGRTREEIIAERCQCGACRFPNRRMRRGRHSGNLGAQGVVRIIGFLFENAVDNVLK